MTLIKQMDDLISLAGLRMKERELLLSTLKLMRDTARRYVAEGIPEFDEVVAKVDEIVTHFEG